MAIQGFGIPKRVVNKKEELFPFTPVVTMLKWEGKNFTKKFEFNERAVEVLGVIPGNSRVNFAFDTETKEAYIAKQSGDDSVLVAKNHSFANKKFYDYIIKSYDLDEAVDNYLALTDDVDLGDVTIYKLLPTTPEAEIIETPSPVIDKEIQHLVDTEEDEIIEKDEVPEFTASYLPHGDNF